MLILLHKLGVINDKLLKHAIGMKCDNNKYIHITGAIAKYFSCNTAAYLYPLFKTHKPSPDILIHASIFDIPVGLLQSAGHIPTSRITAFLEMLLQPICIDFCQTDVNEYCRDSQQYRYDLNLWKSKASFTQDSRLL